MSQIQLFKIGQLYKSKGEPELGLGHVVALEDKILTLLYPKSQETRTYNTKNAPLQRMVFSVQDQVMVEDLGKVSITKVKGTPQELILYVAGNSEFHESSILSSTDEQNVLSRFLDGEWDSLEMFQLRFETHWHKNRLQHSSVRGLLGPKIQLLPHQLYLTSLITQRPASRVLLADEVGLGKTIEAGLIVHKLLANKSISRVLIVPPAPLVNQWFTEMHQLFNLSFHVVEEEGTSYEDDEDLTWDNLPLVITSLDYLANKESRLELLFASHWDLVVIDEAHRLEWTVNEGPSVAYELVESLAYRIPSVLLLSATPEQLGPMGHFARLKLLDPARFSNFDQYLLESKNFHQISDWMESLQGEQGEIEKIKEFMGPNLYKVWSELKNKEDKIDFMIEHFGPGRVYFRNTRKSLISHGMNFPKRILKSYCLTPSSHTLAHFGLIEESTSNDSGAGSSEKLDWIVDFVKNNPNLKFLLLTKLKKNVLAIEHRLEKSGVSLDQIAVFHSQMSHTQRDAKAASFQFSSATQKGPRILLSTELGSEGRNFQKCADLILYDIPLEPDLLEQRMGRLDRLGQTQDMVIHVPFLKNTYEELLLDWYDKGLHLFDSPSSSASLVFEQLHKELKLILLKSEDFLHTQKWQNFLTKTHQLDLSLKSAMEKGRDRLIEYQSYQPKIAQQIVEDIKDWEKSHYLEDYLDSVFHLFNVQQQDLNKEKNVFFIKPDDNMMIGAFPCLPPKGISYTFDREYALDNMDLQLMSWDHELVGGVMDFILSNPLGNVSVCGTHKKQQFGNNPFLMELIFTWNLVAPGELMASKYIPDQFLRIVVDAQGKTIKSSENKENDFEEWQLWNDTMITLKPSDLKLSNMSQLKEYLKKWPKAELDKMIKVSTLWSHKQLNTKLSFIKEKFVKSMDSEIQRLLQMKLGNMPVKKEEIQFLEHHKSQLLEAFNQTPIKLDALRLIILV